MARYGTVTSGASKPLRGFHTSNLEAPSNRLTITPNLHPAPLACRREDAGEWVAVDGGVILDWGDGLGDVLDLRARAPRTESQPAWSYAHGNSQGHATRAVLGAASPWRSLEMCVA